MRTQDQILPTTGLELRSLVTRAGELRLSFARAPLPSPADNEVLIRVEASPINPSDLGVLFSAADMSTASATGRGEQRVVTARIPEAPMKGLAGRVDVSMPVGNEGAGVVVGAGSAEAAKALVGRRVAFLAGGGAYAEYRAVAAEQCLPLPEDASAADGASSFVNPLTVLGMLEAMRHEGHSALVHTAAASSLGQMLHRACAADGVPLVNVVRRAEQEAQLRALGAKWVCNSSAPTFMADLTDALAATGATIGFDATGGGALAGQLLTCMEAALNRASTTYNRYGSSTHKQVYIYGGLDTSPTELRRNFGMAWASAAGWYSRCCRSSAPPPPPG